mgnify:CR=1 FL=1
MVAASEGYSDDDFVYKTGPGKPDVLRGSRYSCPSEHAPGDFLCLYLPFPSQSQCGAIYVVDT